VGLLLLSLLVPGVLFAGLAVLILTHLPQKPDAKQPPAPASQKPEPMVFRPRAEEPPAAPVNPRVASPTKKADGKTPSGKPAPVEDVEAEPPKTAKPGKEDVP
jgi:hypothetical protein